MVGDRGIEPLTSSVSTKRSTPELTAHKTGLAVVYTEHARLQAL
jgi:hypothetical protein